MDHYLDNSATTKVCPEAAEAALRAMTEVYGNPSSTHTPGREAKKLLEQSRRQVADALGCQPKELVFTSCGSESDNWALLAGAEAMKRKGRHIVSSAVEHDAIRRSLDELEARGFEVTRLMPESSGAIPVPAVREALRADTVLVSLMLVNNETGAVTDIAGVSRVLREAASPALLHTDAVQAFLKVPFTPKSLGADMISVSGHKIHAPKGVGALYVKSGLRLKPFVLGGGQEDGRRAGTEAMPQIAAFGAACAVGKAGMAENTARMAAYKRGIVGRGRSTCQKAPPARRAGGAMYWKPSGWTRRRSTAPSASGCPAKRRRRTWTRFARGLSTPAHACGTGEPRKAVSTGRREERFLPTVWRYSSASGFLMISRVTGSMLSRSTYSAVSHGRSLFLSFLTTAPSISV